MAQEPTAGVAYSANPFDMAPSGRIERGWSLMTYLEHPAPSRTDLWTIHTEGPYAYHWWRERGGKDETDAMRLGTATHIAILEPEHFDARVTVYEKTRRGADWDGFSADHAEQTILTLAQYERAVRMRDYVRSKPNLSRLFAEGLTEQTMVWRDYETGLDVKSRPDFIDLERGRIVDLKTASKLDEWSLMRSARDNGYQMQGAMFLDGASECREALGVQITDVWLLYVLSDGPPHVKLRRLPDEVIAEGRAQFRSAMDTYAECWRKGAWPEPEMEYVDLFWETKL